MAVWALVAFWVVIGLAVFLIAMRGGRRRRPAGGDADPGAAARAEAATNRLVTIGSVAVLLAFGIALPAIVVANGGEDRVRQAPGGVDLNAAQANGREQFTAAGCHQCHTLRASNAVGRVGPNLDQLRPPKELVLDAIAKGRARGNGQMPANLLQGGDAQDVAAYIAAVAGH